MHTAWGLTMILLNTFLEELRDTEASPNHLQLGCREDVCYTPKSFPLRLGLKICRYVEIGTE